MQFNIILCGIKANLGDSHTSLCLSIGGCHHAIHAMTAIMMLVNYMCICHYIYLFIYLLFF